MKKILSLFFLATFTVAVASAQTKPEASSTPRPRPTDTVPQRPTAAFDLAEYGVRFQSDPRVIIMMAALEAAGFDPSIEGAPSVFRSTVRKDLADLDPDLRNRMRAFYQRNKLPAPATAADQAARYVSLALALGPAPDLEAPTRALDLPGSLLEVLDFAPLVQEFYRRSQFDEKLVGYTRAYQSEGDRLRVPTAEMVRAILSYLHTRPTMVALERVPVKAPSSRKKNEPVRYTIREHSRNFNIIPDLLGAPGTVNFRIIGDEYYAIVPEGTDPSSSELRRGYLQYVIDPLMLRFNREIAAQREPIRQILAAAEQGGATVSPDVFLAVSRSLVAAADARFDETRKLETLSREARTKLSSARDDASRQAIARSTQTEMTAIQDETIARLSEDYERGAVLAFMFADELKGIESSGFDIANFFADMISSINPARESKRLADNAGARQRALAARQARLSARSVESTPPSYSPAEAARATLLVSKLGDIEQTLRLKDYNAAEARLKDLLKEFPREPRVFFALAQTASLAAADATDEDVQAERLNRALGNYRLAVEASSPETDRAIISRSHEAMGRIYSFLEKNVEATKEFDEAIRMGDVLGGAYKEAIEGKKKVGQP